MTAALLVVPGVALAEEPPSADPLGSLTQQGEGLSQDVKDAVTGLLPAPVLPGAGSLPLPGTTPGAGTGTGTGTGTPSLTPPDLGPLQTLFDALGVPESCTTAVTGDLVDIVTSVPATVQAIAGQLQAALEAVQADPESLPDVLQGQIMTLLGGLGGTPGADPDADGVPLITAVQNLVTDFLANCLPKPAPASNTTAPVAPAAQQSTPPAAAPATTAPAAPVAYLGYAPTGVDTDEPGASTPLLALGGVLLLGGGVAGTWMRLRRGVPSRG